MTDYKYNIYSIDNINNIIEQEAATKEYNFLINNNEVIANKSIAYDKENNIYNSVTISIDNHSLMTLKEYQQDYTHRTEDNKYICYTTQNIIYLGVLDDN